jgi:type IV pilus assembly protein PilC
MLFSARVDLRSLAGLCRRLAMSTASGIDARTMWSREAEHASGALRVRLVHIRDEVSRGEGVAEALAGTGAFFPSLFREMAAVGEETGSLAEVFRRLAEHYEYQVSVRRLFSASLVWPIIQLVFALAVVAVLIWFSGFTGVDMLGVGITGKKGLIIYAAILAASGAGLALAIAAVRRGALWTKGISRAALFLPGVGTCLETLALARFAWTLHLTLNVAMDVRRSLRLALASTGNDHYARHADAVASDLAAGREIHEALRRTRAFPNELLDALEVAEHSGQMAEQMGRLSTQYDEQAQTATKTLATIAGFVIWAMVATLIIVLIFRLAGFYFGRLQDAARGKF